MPMGSPLPACARLKSRPNPTRNDKPAHGVKSCAPSATGSRFRSRTRNRCSTSRSTSQRRKRAEPKEGEPAKIVGYDATGVVAATGPDVTLFKPGDDVWYAGSIIRPGTNSEFHLVDERIVGRKPKSLDFAAAA